jgi:polysaccharide pyruvyl transferase WcaK-like protein
MIIELRGAGFINKGAELMLMAVVDQVSHWRGEHIVAARLDVGNPRQRSQVELHHLLLQGNSSRRTWLQSLVTDQILCRIPQETQLISRKTRRQHRIVFDSDVQAVLDASGFAYGDQWRPLYTKILEKEVKRWRKKDRKIILLPQAFGPFTNIRIRDAMLHALDGIDLVFARDRESYQHLIDLSGVSQRIKLAPDFTNLVIGKANTSHPVEQPYSCIIPNQLMVKKTTATTRNHYISFLKQCVEFLDERGWNPVFLIHEGKKDYELAIQAQSHLRRPIQIIWEADPLLVKSIVGGSRVVISSRFHGIVNALSQGVPCLAAGWSHKYPMLLDDYGCPECFISDVANHDEIIHRLGLVTEEPSRSEICTHLVKESNRKRELVNEMWKDVQKTLKVDDSST